MVDVIFQHKIILSIDLLNGGLIDLSDAMKIPDLELIGNEINFSVHNLSG